MKAGKRKPDFVLLTAAAALLLLLALAAGSFFLRGPTTMFRNYTREDIRYTIVAGISKVPQVRLLKPEKIDRFRTRKPMEITYSYEGHDILFIAGPGGAFVFRYNEEDRPQIYRGSHQRDEAVDLAPYVQTPLPVVEKMLEMAGLGPKDVLYDIGCGDGRIIIQAAKKYGARGVGIDINPRLVAAAQAAAKKEGLELRTRFLCMDATKANLAEATVVTLYLLPESNELLRPILERQLRPGARVVSHNYSMPGWKDRLIGRETVRDGEGVEHRVYAYRIEQAKPS